VLEDADIDVWGEVRPLCVEALGIAIDNAVLFGTNKPSSWPTALVTAAGTASNTVAKGTYADLYEDILGETGVIALLEADGFIPTGHIAHLTLRGLLRSLRDSEGGLIFTASPQEANSYVLDGVPIEFPLNGAMSSSYPFITGQWNQLVYAMRQDITFKILSEAVIQDAGGNIIYNLAQQDMVALRVVMRLGFQLPNPINRIQTVEASRYPFATLTA
jgi:HK97 family phage major capsid protein